MTQLIIVLILVVTLSSSVAKGESQRHWVKSTAAAALEREKTFTQSRHFGPPSPAQDHAMAHQTPPCYPACKVTSSSQSQARHQDEYQTKENISRNLEADTRMTANTLNFIKKREATSSTEKIYDIDLHNDDNLQNEIEDTSNNKDTVSDVFNTGDVAIPYDSLGWFSKAVEVAMDGSLYIGLALGIMYISASVLSGAIGVFGETCLICAFIGYANTVTP